MTSKLQIKLGQLELAFEGSEEFIKNDLTNLLEQVKKLGNVFASTPPSTASSGQSAASNSGVQNDPHPGSIDRNLTTSTIAAHLSANTGADLVIAAMARICVVGGAQKVTRRELTTEMRTATAYFKDNYVSNLTRILRTLITSKRINDLGSNTYALSASERTSLESKVAGAS